MHPVFAALLFTLSALAQLPDFIQNGSPITVDHCWEYEPVLLCATYGERQTSADRNWKTSIQDHCDTDPPPCAEDPEKCRLKCKEKMRRSREFACRGICAVSLRDHQKGMPSSPDEPSAAPASSPGGVTSAPSAIPSGSAAPGPGSSKKPATPSLASPTPSRSGSASPPSEITGATAPTPGCTAAAGCDAAGGASQRAGESDAKARKDLFESDAREERDMSAKSLAGALRVMKKLQAQVTPSTPPETKARVASDGRLVNRAQDALGPSRRGDFNSDDAKSAFDPVVRQELLYATSGTRMGEDFSREAAESQKLEDALHALAAQSDQHVAALSSDPSPADAAGRAVRGATAASAGVTGGASSAAVNEGRTDAKLTSATATAAAKAAADGRDENADKAGSAGGHFAPRRGAGSSEPALRERLKRELAAKARAEALEASSSFGGGLKQVSRSGEGGASSSAAAAAEDIVSEAYRGMRGRSFALGASSETEAELRRLTRVEEASLPGAEGPSLFERVRRAHRSCQQRSCVLSAAP